MKLEAILCKLAQDCLAEDLLPLWSELVGAYLLSAPEGVAQASREKLLASIRQRSFLEMGNKTGVRPGVERIPASRDLTDALHLDYDPILVTSVDLQMSIYCKADFLARTIPFETDNGEKRLTDVIEPHLARLKEYFCERDLEMLSWASRRLYDTEYVEREAFASCILGDRRVHTYTQAWQDLARLRAYVDQKMPTANDHARLKQTMALHGIAEETTEQKAANLKIRLDFIYDALVLYTRFDGSMQDCVDILREKYAFPAYKKEGFENLALIFLHVNRRDAAILEYSTKVKH